MQGRPLFLVIQYFRYCVISSVSWYFFMSSFVLSLHLFFGRLLLLHPESSSLSDFAHMWLYSRIKQWPYHFSLLFSWKVSTGFMCVSFPMSSFLMCSNLFFLLAHSTSSFLLKFTLLSESHLSFYGPTFITVCHCWSGDCFEDVVFQFHGHLPIAHHPGYFLPLRPHDSDPIVDISL